MAPNVHGSESGAAHVRAELVRIRAEAARGLIEGRGIDEVQTQLSLELEGLLVQLAQASYVAVGPAPCKFLLFTAGSLARLEACPYSDLDYGVLVEADSLEAEAWAQELAVDLKLRIKSAEDTGFKACWAGSATLPEMNGTPSALAANLERDDQNAVVRSLLNVRPVFGDAALKDRLDQELRRSLRSRPDSFFEGFRVAPAEPDDTLTLDVKADAMASYQMTAICLTWLWSLTGDRIPDRLRDAARRGLLDRNLASALVDAIQFLARLRFRAHLQSASGDDRVRLTRAEAAAYSRHFLTLSALQDVHLSAVRGTSWEAG